MLSIQNILPFGVVALALLVRWQVAQFPHSGEKTPPLFGDYEAQRHWMEITTNLPVEDWYRNTTDNDLLYWGIDYPPLTAYHMYILGRASKLINSSWTELHKSRGTESYEHKIYMRSTVILVDLLLFIPAIIYYFFNTQPCQYTSPPSTVHKQNVLLYTVLVLLYPAQILIDHGHYQYNCVFMGLVLWSIIFMNKGKQASSALFFTLALNYKQMSLYYSLPFFWYIASLNLRVKPLWKGLRNIVLIGFIVVSTTALLFLPFLSSKESLLQVIHRIFPFYRGVFEDKVANIWFSLSILYKYRNFYTLEQLLRASAGLTLLASLPAGLHLLFKPSLKAFRYALVNTSLIFFLTSFQVHEKTILVPALPILLMCREHPMAINWFITISTFSLQPLLLKDGQIIPYFVLMTIFTLLSLEFFKGHTTLNLTKVFSIHNMIIVTYLTSILACYVLSGAAVLVKPPPRYPDIHPTLNSLFCCVHFIGFLLFFYFRQFWGYPRRNLSTDRIYLIKKTN